MKSLGEINDTPICPIVVNVVEGVKVELGWLGVASEHDQEKAWFIW